MPPTAPCSITHVTLPCCPSSSRTRGTLAEMPKPMLTAQPARSSCATRRAMTLAGVELRRAEGVAAGGTTRPRSPDHRRSPWSATGPAPRRSRRPGYPAPARHAACSDAALRDPLDLRDDETARIAGGQRHLHRAQRGALVLEGQVAVLVGGRGADDRDIGAGCAGKCSQSSPVEVHPPHQRLAPGPRRSSRSPPARGRRRSPCRPWSARRAAWPRPRAACRTRCPRGRSRPRPVSARIICQISGGSALVGPDGYDPPMIRASMPGWAM